MTSRVVEFYFDYISPNAYLAWTRIHAIAARHDATVDPVPVLFAGILQATGRPGPAEVPDMWRWMVRNILRKASVLGVPLHPPPTHPFNPLLALRVSSLEMPDPVRRSVVDGLFRSAWGGGGGVEDPEIVAEVARAAGLDGEGSIAMASSQESKDRLRRQTDRAIERHVFGLPAMVVDGELFWGPDDLPFMERFLEGEDPLRRETLAGWESLRHSAWRRERPERRS